MTSEIALMNRRAVALAADSATTVTYWDSGVRKQRYFKGANKIFNLSATHPVALMTYDTGTLQGVPWDVIVKAYRSDLGSRAQTDLPLYGKHLFDFIGEHKYFYTPEFLIEQFKTDIREAAGLFLYVSDNDKKAGKEEIFSTEKDPAKKATLAESRFTEVTNRLEKAPFIGDATQTDVDKVMAAHLATATEAVKVDKYVGVYGPVIDYERLARIAVKMLFKRYFTTLDKTGIVIAGFGENDYFPRLEVFDCYGKVIDRLLYEGQGSKQITQTNVSEVLPFAQSEIAKGFMYGLNPSILDQVSTKFTKGLDSFEAKLRASERRKPTPAQLKKVEEIKKAELDGFSKELMQELLSAHTKPMKQAVGLLPVDELAELAEILVRMESLKERVTRETEEVGGPIDVAVISKGDGFIWIKRKHYFDPKLNPRFFTRKGMTPHV